MALNSPNYTQTPNDLFDRYLAEMSGAELKVVLYAIRQTFGYHRKSDEISLSQFMKATGLSKQGVLNGLGAAIDRGIMQVDGGTGKRGIKRYSLVISDDVSIKDMSNKLTSTSQNSRPVKAPTGQPSRHTKEREEKEREKKSLEDQNHPPEIARAREATAGVGVETHSLPDMKKSLQEEVKPPGWDIALAIARHNGARNVQAYANGVLLRQSLTRPAAEAPVKAGGLAMSLDEFVMER